MAKKKPKAVAEVAPAEIEAHKAVIDASNVAGVVSTLDRDIDMFREWLRGKTMAEVAKKYGIRRKQLYNIAAKYKWTSMKKQAVRRLHERASTEMQGMIFTSTVLLKRDLERIAGNAVRKKRDLTKDERRHFLSLLELLLKEQRLEDGKPTGITSDTKRVELVLPPGMKTFGIIPPDPRVVYVESKVEDKPDTFTLEDAGIEDDE